MSEPVTDPEILAQLEALEAERTGRGEALARGAVQGLTAGFGDEIAGVAKAGMVGPTLQLPPPRKELLARYPGSTLPQALMRWHAENRRSPGDPGTEEWARRQQEQNYRAGRDETRAANEKARADQPGYYLGGQLGGGLPLVALTGGAAAPTLGAGVVQGAGYSSADTAGGLARDSAVGGLLSLGSYGLAKGLGGASKWALGKARGGLDKALAKATALEAEKRAAALASAKGTLGAATAERNRVVQAIRELLDDPSLTPAQRATLDRLKGTPEYADAVESLTASVGPRLSGVAGKVAQGEAGVAAVNASKPVAQAAAERVGGKAAKEQILARVLRYGPPALGSAVGGAIGGPFGIAVGSLAGAGTRPMVQSLRRMVQDPAVATQILRPVAKVAEAGASAPARILNLSLARAGLGGLVGALPSIASPSLAAEPGGVPVDDPELLKLLEEAP